ncbi:MAG: hypothetical protein VB131_06025 [Burkholderia gladioli]
MPSHLNLVSPSTPPCVDFARVMPADPPKTFDASFMAKLKAVNRAGRTLRSLGIRVDRIAWTEPVPVVFIARRPDVSFGAMLDAMGPRTYRSTLTETKVSGPFMDVTVCWLQTVEPAAAQPQ